MITINIPAGTDRRLAESLRSAVGQANRETELLRRETIRLREEIARLKEAAGIS